MNRPAAALNRPASASFLTDLMALTAAIGVVTVLYAAVQHFYFGGAFLDAISYVNDETTLNEIIAGLLGQDPSLTAVGIHAFGDFLQPHYWVTLTDPWLEDGTNMINYLPGVLVIHEVLALLPYRAAFLVYEIGMVAALTLPMFLATKGQRLSIRILAVIILGLLAGPAIASLDRGNTQGFVPLLVFGAAIAMMRARWGWASVFLILVGTLKIYPLVLVLVLIALRKWVWACVTLIGTVVVNIALLPFVSSNLWPTLRLVFLNPLEYGQRTFEDFMAYNVSLAGGLAHAFTFMGLPQASLWIAEHSLLIGVLALVCIAPLLWLRDLDLWVRIIVAMLLMSAVMPLAYPYALNWVVAGSAVAVYVVNRLAISPDVRSPRWQWLPVLIALALLTAPYPFYIPGSMETGIPASALALVSAVVSVALPLALWLGWLRHRGRTADREVLTANQ